MRDCAPTLLHGRALLLLALLVFAAVNSRATLLWDGNATKGLSVFKILNIEGTNGSSVTAVDDPIYGKVWRFYKALDDHRCEEHGAAGFNPAIGQTYYIGWRTKLIMPVTAGLNAIFQWKAYGSPLLQNFPITIAPGNGNLGLNEYNPSSAGGHTLLWTAPFVTNAWVQHVLVISVSDQDYGGYIEYWNNGVKQTFLTGTNRFYCRTFDGTSVDPKWGAYGGDIYTVYDYVSGLKIGTTYADVVDTLFAMTASPPSQNTGVTGTNISYAINLVTNTGFSGNVQLSVSGLPANSGYTFTPTNFSGPGVATLNVTTFSNTPQGTYTLLFRAISAGKTNYTTAEMTVAKVPATFTWNGPGAGTNNWSAEANWSPLGGPPTAIDTVNFFNPGAVSGISNVNNFVDGAFGGAVASLQFGNTNNNHTTAIANGQTLNFGALTVGTETDNGTAQSVFATVTGAGGTLALNSSSDLVVRQGSGSSGSQRGTLDLSGLGTFDGVAGRVLVGVAGPVARATGTLYLGRTNRIILAGAYPQVCVGDNHGNGGGQNFLYLGQVNNIFADSITIGRQKATATMSFTSRFTSSAAYFRATDGESPVGLWNIGDASTQSASSSSTSGTNDFSLGSVDALVDLMNVGVGQTATGGNGSGLLTFSAGMLNVNTLQIGVQSQADATSAGIGRVNVNGSNAVLVVNSTLALGVTSGGAGTTNTSGTLNINGGKVFASNIVAGANSGSNSIAINGGELVVSNVIGSAAVGLNRMSLTNATLGLWVTNSRVNLRATNLLTGGASNVIRIVSLPTLGGFPAQFQLVKYSGGISGAGYNFVLGTMPVGPVVYSGYLSNNVSSLSVDLVVTNSAPAPPPRFVNVGLSGTNFILSGVNGVANWPYVVLTATNPAQPLSQWQRIATNVFDNAGNFSFTNSMNLPRVFYRLQLQ